MIFDDSAGGENDDADDESVAVIPLDNSPMEQTMKVVITKSLHCTTSGGYNTEVRLQLFRAADR